MGALDPVGVLPYCVVMLRCVLEVLLEVLLEVEVVDLVVGVMRAGELLVVLLGWVVGGGMGLALADMATGIGDQTVIRTDMDR